MATAAQVAPACEISIAQPLAAPWSTARKAFCLALGLRLFYSLFAALSSPGLRLDQALIHSNRLTGNLINRESRPLLYAFAGVWQRFDTLWYLHIARSGYDNPAATVFYPLYPGLTRAVSILLHSDLASALIVSTAASFFVFWGALRLFELDYSPEVSLRALLLWIAWPAAFAFFAGYPDSLLCALTIWSLYFARSGRWLASGTLGAFAGLTKALGCLTALPLLWIAWKRRDGKGYFAALPCLAAVVIFQGWLAIGHWPSATQIYRTYWATATVAPWISARDAVVALAHGGDRLLLLNATVLAIAAAATLTGPVRFEYKLYAVAAIFLFLTKHTDPLLQSTTRYSLALFAAYPAMSARLGRGLSFASVLFIAAVLNLFLLRTFLDWGLVV